MHSRGISDSNGPRKNMWIPLKSLLAQLNNSKNMTAPELHLAFRLKAK
jgi:hypothetical protein